MNRRRVRYIVVFGGLLAIFANVSALANGVYENRSWQFQTSADRANSAFVRDLIEKKKGGYYDAFETNINNTYTTTNSTTIEGDQINCSVSPNALGNSSSSAMDSATSSPTVSPGSGVSAGSTGNEATNNGGVTDNSPLNNDQNNSGDQYAQVTDLNATAGPVDASGGQTSQALNNQQNNSGAQYASVSDSQSCAFTGDGGAPLN